MVLALDVGSEPHMHVVAGPVYAVYQVGHDTRVLAVLVQYVDVGRVGPDLGDLHLLPRASEQLYTVEPDVVTVAPGSLNVKHHLPPLGQLRYGERFPARKEVKSLKSKVFFLNVYHFFSKLKKNKNNYFLNL